MSENDYRPNSHTINGAPDRKSGGKGTKKAMTRRFGVKITLSWMMMAWERVWPHIWLPVSIAALFAAVAMFDVLPNLSGWLHTVILVLFAGAFVGSVFWALRRIKLPESENVRRRLETTSGLDHRPLSTTEDNIAVGSGDAFGEAVWQAHQKRAAERLNALKVGAPRPPVAKRDPWALRGAALLLLVSGLLIGWSDADDRMIRAVMPAFEATDSEEITAEVWLTPPDYTGKPPRMLTRDDANRTVTVPDGTKIMIQIHGGRGQPHLRFGKQDVTLASLDRTSFQGEVLAKHSGRLRVRQRARNVIDWTVKVTPDKKPEVKFAKKPSVTGRSSIKLDHQAKDDYRLKSLRAFVARQGEVEIVTLKVPAPGGPSAKGSSYHNLTAHRWAGLDVSVVLEAEDDAGNLGRSKVMDLTLPERVFRHPVARALIAQRKNLTRNPIETFRVVLILGAIAEQRKSYNNDPVVYLTVRTAQARLITGTHANGRDDSTLRSDRHKAIRSVQSLLWNAALRIEEGGSSDVERELRNVQRKLRELLSRKNIKDKELKRLMDELRRAMKRYMEALRRDMKRNPEKYARRPVDPKAKNFNPQDMKQMLEQMRRMMQNGDKKALRRMLSQLNKMMRNMRPGQPQRRVDPNHPAMRMMRQLNGLIQKQQKLMDESFRRGQKNRGNQRRDPKADKEAQKRQQALRKQLGEMMRKLGEMTGKVPKNFGNAENQMRRSQQRLGKGQPGQSVGPQGRALRELRRGAGQAMRQLARRFGLGMGRQNSARGGRGRLPRDRDPLGRKLDGMGPLDTEDVKIPSEAERKKVRDILRELRKRSGERVRPKMERDYIDRLLKRF